MSAQNWITLMTCLVVFYLGLSLVSFFLTITTLNLIIAIRTALDWILERINSLAVIAAEIVASQWVMRKCCFLWLGDVSTLHLQGLQVHPAAQAILSLFLKSSYPVSLSAMCRYSILSSLPRANIRMPPAIIITMPAQIRYFHGCLTTSTMQYCGSGLSLS